MKLARTVAALAFVALAVPAFAEGTAATTDTKPAASEKTTEAKPAVKKHHHKHKAPKAETTPAAAPAK